MCCKNILGCAVIIACIAVAVICVIAMAIPVWYDKSAATVTQRDVKMHTLEGLWQKCVKYELVDSSWTCENLWDLTSTDYTHAKKAVLAMSFLGVFGIIVTAVLMALHLTLCGTFELLTKIAGIVAAVAGLLILIGIIVYGTSVKDDVNFGGSDLSAGFGLSLTSAIACFIIAGICFFVK